MGSHTHVQMLAREPASPQAECAPRPMCVCVHVCTLAHACPCTWSQKDLVTVAVHGPVRWVNDSTWGLSFLPCKWRQQYVF